MLPSTCPLWTSLKGKQREEGYLHESESFGAETAPDMFFKDTEVIKDWEKVVHLNHKLDLFMHLVLNKTTNLLTFTYRPHCKIINN